MSKEVYTVTEVSKIFKVSTVTVNRLLKNNKLNGFRPSEKAHWKIPRRELIKYMDGNNIPMEFLKKDKIKILIIDDEVLVTKAIQETFRDSTDFLIETANSGFSAGVTLENFKPDIVILDILLDEIDGREFFKYIKNHPELIKTKVIGISGKVEEEEIAEIMEMGFNKFISKPIEFKILKKIVQEMI